MLWRRAGRMTAVLATACLLASLGSPAANAEPQSKPLRAGKVTVQVFADREAVAPGSTLNLAVALTMDEGWYVYWRNPGGMVGLPTEFNWTVPAGYQVGRVRFPAPKIKFDKIIKEHNYIHKGTAIFVTPIRVPQDAEAGSGATFAAKVSWLVCEKSCIPGDAEVSLTLPIVAGGAEVKRANEDVFKKANASLPTPAADAKHVKFHGSVSKEAVKPGDKFTATLTADIQPGHHMQSHKPLQDGLIPAALMVEPTRGFEIGDVKYAKPHEREDNILGKLSEYEGKIAFEIPITVEEDADQSPRWVRGVFQYQVCTDSGTCYPPEHVEFAIPVQMAGGPAPGDSNSFITASNDTSRGGEDQSATDQAAQAETSAEDSAGSGSDKNILIRLQERLMNLGFFGVMLAAFIGGFLLNLMPCVLPVISLKVLSFVRQAHEDRWRVFRLGLTYSAGIMVFYVVLAVLFFRSGIAWGELFQHPLFVIIMSAVILAFSMSLFGVFAIFTPRVVNKLGEKAEAQEGYLSAFGTGVLATLLGTACTAPLLSMAISYATKLPPMEGGFIFIAAGFGMASPFIVLTYNPAWLRFVPRPGPWMGVFESIMGFLLLATVIWLLHPLPAQIGGYGLLLTLIFLLSVAIAVWIKGKIEFSAPLARKVRLYGAALVVLLVGWLLPFNQLSSLEKLEDEQILHEDLAAQGQFCLALHGDNSRGTITWTGWQDAKAGEIPWQHYINREQALIYVNAGYTVFVDYTADWCASCKTNLKTSIDHSETIKLMRELNVVPFEADYTNRRKAIKEDLTHFNRAGVPLYLVYSPGDPDAPEKLPEILTPGIVLDALNRAGPSKPTGGIDD
ncbi:MAG: protein-disulfide reductase DsbD domain-containing protein [Planctomycetota bacterium]